MLPPILWFTLTALLLIACLLLAVAFLRQKRLAATSRSERDQLRAILDALPMLVAHVDASEHFTFGNHAYERWFGHSSHKIKGMKLSEVIGEAAYAAGQDEIQRALAGELSILHNISYEDGGERCVRGTLIPDKRFHGETTGFFAIVEDVTSERVTERELARYREQLEDVVQERTADLMEANRQLERYVSERTEIEQALRASEEHFRLLTENSRDTIFRFDLLPEPRLSYVSPAVERLTGFTPEEHYANPELWMELVHPDDREPLMCKGDTAPQMAEPIEVRWQKKDGSYFWYELRFVPIFDESGNLATIVGISRDINQRKQQEREREAVLAVSLALRAANNSEEMLSVILGEIAATFDAEKVFYITPDTATQEMVVKSVFESGKFSPDVNVRIGQGKGVAAYVYRTGEAYVSEDAASDPRFATPEMLGDGRAVACVPLIAQEQTIGLFSVARRLPMSGSDVRLLSALADMAATGLQRAAYHEETLRHAALLEEAVTEQTSELREAYERLQELDALKSKFVSDVSHELRTPVTNIGLYLGLIKRKPEKLDQYLAILREEADRLEKLVLDILDLARLDNDPSLALTPVNLNELLQQVIASHSAKADSRHLELSLHPGDNLPMIMADSQKLIQVANNLVANAINYTPSGYVRVGTQAQGADAVSFCVEDSGTGIYAEDMPYLTERFYRGKRDKLADVPGTGLGLSLVKELVGLHGGSLDIQSNVGKGTIFTVTLPVASNAGR